MSRTITMRKKFRKPSVGDVLFELAYWNDKSLTASILTCTATPKDDDDKDVFNSEELKIENVLMDTAVEHVSEISIFLKENGYGDLKKVSKSKLGDVIEEMSSKYADCWVWQTWLKTSSKDEKLSTDKKD